MSALEQAHFDLRLQRTDNRKVDLPHGRDKVPGSISVAVILAGVSHLSGFAMQKVSESSFIGSDLLRSVYL